MGWVLVGSRWSAVRSGGTVLCRALMLLDTFASPLVTAEAEFNCGDLVKRDPDQCTVADLWSSTSRL